MRRLLLLAALALILLPAQLAAKPRVKSVAVNDAGQARVALSQKQIFDEVGGKAKFGVDFPKGLAVLTTDLTLPEEAGDVSGQGYASFLPEALSTVADFTYVPLKRKQLKLEVDNRSVEDENQANGHDKFSIDYPLSLEHVNKKAAQYMSRFSYAMTGQAKWSRYTEAEGTLNVQIQDPELKRGKSEVNVFGLRITNLNTTNIWLHWDAVRGSFTARVLQDPELDAYIKYLLGYLQISFQDVNVTSEVKGNSVLADIKFSLYNFRETVLRWEALMMREFRLKGVNREDVSAAVSTMLEVEPTQIEIVLRRQGDHFNAEISAGAKKVDKVILGYLRLREVLEPPLIKAGTQSAGLSELVKNVNAVRTRRFRNVVVATASSQDGGECSYTIKLGFPRGRVSLSTDFTYKSVLTAYNYAAREIGIPTMHQTYSVLKLHTTPEGLKGHYMYEAQGPWFDNVWNLCSEAAKDNAELAALFKDKPTLEEGRLSLDLKKSRVKGAGWAKMSDLTAYGRTVVLGDAEADPLALDMSYDADAAPGKILANLFVKGASRDAVQQAITKSFGKDLKFENGTKLDPPAVAQPKVELAKKLAGEIEADRKLLGVAPWVAPPASEKAPETAHSSGRTMKIIAFAIVGLLAVVGLFVVRPYLGGKEMGPPAQAPLPPLTSAAPPATGWRTTGAGGEGAPGPAPFGGPPAGGPAPFGVPPGPAPFGASQGSGPAPFGGSQGSGPAPFGASQGPGPAPFGSTPGAAPNAPAAPAPFVPGGPRPGSAPGAVPFVPGSPRPEEAPSGAAPFVPGGPRPGEAPSGAAPFVPGGPRLGSVPLGAPVAGAPAAERPSDTPPPRVPVVPPSLGAPRPGSDAPDPSRAAPSGVTGPGSAAEGAPPAPRVVPPAVGAPRGGSVPGLNAPRVRVPLEAPPPAASAEPPAAANAPMRFVPPGMLPAAPPPTPGAAPTAPGAASTAPDAAPTASGAAPTAPGGPPAAPRAAGPQDQRAFKLEMEERIQHLVPGCKIEEKDVLELRVTRDGTERMLDLMQLYYLCQKPNIDRDTIIDGYLKQLNSTFS